MRKVQLVNFQALKWCPELLEEIYCLKVIFSIRFSIIMQINIFSSLRQFWYQAILTKFDYKLKTRQMIFGEEDQNTPSLTQRDVWCACAFKCSVSLRKMLQKSLKNVFCYTVADFHRFSVDQPTFLRSLFYSKCIVAVLRESLVSQS